METMQVRRQWNNTLKVVKRNLFTENVISKNAFPNGKIKTFSNKQNR